MTTTSKGSLHSKMALRSPTLDMVVTAVGGLLLFMLALGLLCFFTCRLARPLREEILTPVPAECSVP